MPSLAALLRPRVVVSASVATTAIAATSLPALLAAPVTRVATEFAPERSDPWSTNPANRNFGAPPIDSVLPLPLRTIWSTVDGAIRRGVELLTPDEKAPDATGIRSPLDRAKEADRALVAKHGMAGDPNRFHANDEWQVWRAEAWPVGQVLHGRILQAMQGGDWSKVDGIFNDLEAYRVDDGVVGGILPWSKRYYDDNAWIGLAATQAYGATGDSKYLEHAERTFRMVAGGVHPDGGMYWWEQERDSRNTCSIAPAAELAMQLYNATHDKKYLDFATKQAAWLNDHMRMPSGLYADALHDNGDLEKTPHSYNQGTPMGLDVQLYRATGDAKYLARAKETAKATLEWMQQGDLGWQQAPVFNTIFYRNLLALQSVAPDPSYVKAVDTYLDRVWTEGRNAETGLFSEGGIGSYEKDHPGSVIDQGAIAQLFAARALPPEKWASLT
jgi:hypothetical protein